MYEEVELMQKKYLPSENELPQVVENKLEGYKERHQVVKRASYKDQDAWDDLGDKAMKVYKDGLDDEVDFKYRKATADTVMEVLGKKGGKSSTPDGGTTIVFSDKALENLTSGLAQMFQKDVTRNEDFKISPGHNS